MTTTSFRMIRHSIALFFLAAINMMVFLNSCSKNDQDNHPNTSHSSEVLDKWMGMQIRLMKNATGIPNQAFSRHFVYAGITAVEAQAPGLSSHMNKFRNWNGLTGLPSASSSVKY